MDNSVDNRGFDKIFSLLDYRFFEAVFAIFYVRFSITFDIFQGSIAPCFLSLHVI